MRRPLLLAVVLLTGCGQAAETEAIPPARAAEPQHVELGWRESYPGSGEQIQFGVDAFTVRSDGWSVEIRVTNATSRTFELGINGADLTYGLMLFPTDDLADVEKASREGRLPAVRLAATMKPTPPDVLAPSASWRATISAPGSLADGSYIRVVFGPLRALGDPPKGMQPSVVWITDKAYRL